jgi:hypothetical protein
MLFVVEQYETPDPINVSFFGVVAIMLNANGLVQLI